MDNVIIDLYGKSNHQIAESLGKRYREYRVALGLTRKEISETCGVSAMTLARFENGNASAISLGNLIALLRAIQKLDSIEAMLPHIPESLYKRSKR